MSSDKKESDHPLVQKAELHVEALSLIIDELKMASEMVEESATKRDQLKDISKIIMSWESKSMSVPEEFRRMKEALEAELGGREDTIRALSEIRTGLEPLFKKLNVRPPVSPVSNGTHRSRRPSGTKTPEHEYRQHIVDCLRHHGGKAHVRDIRPFIEKRMRHQFKARDLERGEDGQGEVVWWNTTMWARLQMVKDRILRDDSPRGIWELKNEP